MTGLITLNTFLNVPAPIGLFRHSGCVSTSKSDLGSLHWTLDIIIYNNMDKASLMNHTANNSTVWSWTHSLPGMYTHTHMHPPTHRHTSLPRDFTLCVRLFFFSPYSVVILLNSSFESFFSTLTFASSIYLFVLKSVSICHNYLPFPAFSSLCPCVSSHSESNPGETKPCLIFSLSSFSVSRPAQALAKFIPSSYVWNSEICIWITPEVNESCFLKHQSRAQNQEPCFFQARRSTFYHLTSSLLSN